MNEKLMKKNGLTKEDFGPSDNNAETLAQMAFVNSELALALLDIEGV